MKLAFWKKEETVSKAEHEQALADLEADLSANFATSLALARTDFEQLIGIERDTVGRLSAGNRQLKADLTAARAEAEANKVDAELWRAARDKRKNARRVQVKAEAA